MRFYTRDLLSKWGFGDGDMLGDLIESLGLEIENEKEVLQKVVLGEVIPILDQPVEVELITTIHNPVRVGAVRGVQVDHVRKQPDIFLSPSVVDVDEHVLAKYILSFGIYERKKKK